jgi:hypothetical protein
VVLAAVVGAGSPAASEDLPPGTMSVRYLLEIDGEPPQKGESFCQLHQACLLGFDFDLVQVTLTLGSRTSDDKLTVSCKKIEEDCHLRDTLPALEFREAGLRNFDVLARRNDPDLAMRTSLRIGSLVFQVQGARRVPHSPSPQTRL